MRYNIAVVAQGTVLYVARATLLTWTMDRTKAKPFTKDRGMRIVNDLRLHSRLWPILVKAEVK